MGNLNEFFRDLGRNAYGLGENAASLATAAIAEPVAGFAAILDPKDIRSRFAAFDPFNRDSSNLLAQYGAVAPTATLGAMMYNEQQRKKQGK